MTRAVKDLIPTGPQWTPVISDAVGAQERRRANNERASGVRKAVWPKIQVGDVVLIKDQHPEWKFRTPNERESWEVLKICRTMIKARIGTAKVSHNVSCFKKVKSATSQPAGTAAEEGMDDVRGEESDAEARGPRSGLRDGERNTGDSSCPGRSDNPASNSDSRHGEQWKRTPLSPANKLMPQSEIEGLPVLRRATEMNRAV
ncbi:hypothetical protein NDU88_001144 [Pleurodeles waltl]|uniref:Uncharacterized protein n=1 Tax=Pleurodeles waltl TaxID=8319 RepID=A0AAV7VAY6_PLEWA|nr:hypothetical protein NDU88_001144 [Pleurodeles waltl]